jgi:hypothetical protein
VNLPTSKKRIIGSITLSFTRTWLGERTPSHHPARWTRSRDSQREKKAPIEQIQRANPSTIAPSTTQMIKRFTQFSACIHDGYTAEIKENLSPFGREKTSAPRLSNGMRRDPKRFAFAGEAPANRGYFMEPIIVRHIAGPVVENLLAIPRQAGNG